MPFPTNGSFPVLGYSRPGEAVQSKPKRAIIVRMSPETLDALQDFPNNPPMEFQFGENPRIYIGDSQFNLNPAPETTPHDLYLRASSATKKNPPFKLHANIIGKLTVQRELLPGVGEKVRESTSEALAQRAIRTTVMIENPRALITETKRQKEVARQSQKKKKMEALAGTGASSSRSNGSSLLDKAKHKAVASAERTGTAKVSSNPLDKLSPDKALDIRRRLIHFLAPEERSEDEVVRAIGGPNPPSQSRQVICHILDEVGETMGKDAKYRLKTKAWKEVRPYEWDKWPDPVRTKVCREALEKLSAMGVPEHDSLRAHFAPRRSHSSNGPAHSPSHQLSSSSAQAAGRRGTPEPKRPLMSSDYREKERERAAASRAKGKAEIMAKDESRSLSRNGRESPSEMLRVASSSSSSSRKQPGSGFKAPSSKLSIDITRDTTPSRKTDMRPPASTGRDSPSASSVRSDTQASRTAKKRERAGSVHESDTDRWRPTHAHQGSKLAQRSKVEDGYHDSDVERRRKKAQIDREYESERARTPMERIRAEEREEREPRERKRDKDETRKRREREREVDERERVRGSDREWERNEPERRDRTKANGRDSERDRLSRVKELKREREEGETSDASNASALKRKARPVEEDDDYLPSRSSQKRRKGDPALSGLPPKPKTDPYSDSRYDDRSYSRQSETANSKHIKREFSPSLPRRPSPPSQKRTRSPLPLVSNKRATTSASMDRDTDSRSGSLKPKKSYKQENSDMIYTDSSDSESKSRHKDDLPQRRATSTAHRRANGAAGNLPELPIHPSELAPDNDRNTLSHVHSNGNGRAPSSRNGTSRPHEHLASLQREYGEKFYPYDEGWRSMDAQERAVKKMLKRFKSGVESVSEDDNSLMELEDLEKGVSRLRKMADELIPLDKEIKRLRALA